MPKDEYQQIMDEIIPILQDLGFKLEGIGCCYSLREGNNSHIITFSSNVKWIVYKNKVLDTVDDFSPMGFKKEFYKRFPLSILRKHKIQKLKKLMK